MDQGQGRRLLVCVGSYTEPVPHAPQAHGKGLQIVELDVATGQAVSVFTDDSVVNPAFVCVHPDLPVIYAVSESWTAPGTVTAMRFSPDYTRLLSRTQLPSGGRVPSYVAVVGQWLVLSNYGDGSLASYRLSGDGGLEEQVSWLPLSGRGPDPARQDGPHTHCILPHPTNGFLYAADLGTDTLMRVRLDVDDGMLTVERAVKVPPGSGPRHLVFTPSGDALLLVEELTSTVAVYPIDGAGELGPPQRVSMLPSAAVGRSFAADIAIAPAGDRAFASNRGHDSVVVLDRGPDGSWHACGWTPTGGIPRGLGLTPDGAHLMVASQDSDRVDVFAVSAHGLELEPVLRLPSATPTCVRLLAVR